MGSDINARATITATTASNGKHQVEDFLEAVREDQQQPGGSSELLSSLEKEAGPPTISVEENQRNDESDANRNPEPDGAGVAIEILRGGGGPAGGEKRGSSGSGGNGWWGGATRGFRPAWLVVATFVHEAWLFLQHANVLLNPLCQRLDRGYGIALLRRRLYWVIASVLAAYWAREIASMWLALPYASELAFKMVTVSSVYHVGKILLISVDARRGWSPTLGIMRLLIDYWHLSSLKDALLCIKRVTLQGFDTATHALLVRDMVRWDEEAAGTELGLRRTLRIVVVVWAVHAIANLVTKMSTATLVVEVAKSAVGKWGTAHDKSKRKSLGEREVRAGVFGALDGGSAEFACTTSCSHGHTPCEVCHLLTRDQPATPAAPPRWQKRVD
eukprot:jgi/Undpi1/554/HiC_scaffold_10.g04018.m1